MIGAKKGQIVYYDNGRGATFSAVIRICHRDNSYTVEPRHQLVEGKPCGCYIGGKVRLDWRDVRADA